MSTVHTGLGRMSLVCPPTADRDGAISFYESLFFEKRTDRAFRDRYRWVKAYLGGYVDAEVARTGGPAPPIFWFRDPTGHSLMVVEQS